MEQQAHQLRRQDILDRACGGNAAVFQGYQLVAEARREI
jgi:hypothetical protein